MAAQFCRRNFLQIASAALVGGWARQSYAADKVVTVAQQSGPPDLPASEQLLHTVVRIQCPLGPDSYEAGTGFFYAFFADKNGSVPAIVTNKHVILNHKTCDLIFTARKPDGSPDIDRQIPITVNDIAQSVIPHPDPSVDLAIIPIGGLLSQLEKRGTPPYIKTCNDSVIPSADAFKALTPLEDVLTVGFPGPMWDTAHNLPIFHRGITATPAYVDFQGEKKFLIDAAVWPGASGSPVYLYEQGTLYDPRVNSTSFGFRLQLLGIIFATVVQDVSGNILVQEAPITPHISSAVPSNLGVCIRSSRIFDFQPLLVRAGAKVPDGFIVRTSDS